MTKRNLLIIFYLFSLFFPLSSAQAFIILSTNRFAWSNNVGYINFEGVTVEDGALAGFAWSANKGFINFAPAQAGVLNDGAGNLSGFAWGEQLGYIDFENVSINGATGQFSGIASGTLVGTITFDCPNFCDVVTDWRSAIIPPPPVLPGINGGAGNNVGGGRSRIIGSTGGNGVPASASGILLPNAGALPALFSTGLSPAIFNNNTFSNILNHGPGKVANIFVDLPNSGLAFPPGNVAPAAPENLTTPLPPPISESPQSNFLSFSNIQILMSILMFVLAYVLFKILR